MSWLGKFLRSTIGQKFVMAVSGLMLVGFVVAHMLGNLQVFLGREALNDYAALLQGNQGLLWVAYRPHRCRRRASGRLQAHDGVTARSSSHLQEAIMVR